MTDPWSEPSRLQARGTRFVCPFDDWFHDEPDEPIDEIPADVTAGATTLEEMTTAIVTAQLAAKHSRIDGLIRAHLETHTLEEWFAAAVKLQHIQQSASVLIDGRPPSTERLHDALCQGVFAINDARWIQHAKALIDALSPGASHDPS